MVFLNKLCRSHGSLTLLQCSIDQPWVTQSPFSVISRPNADCSAVVVVPHVGYPMGDVECNKEMRIMSKQRSRWLGKLIFLQISFLLPPVTFWRNSRTRNIEFFTSGERGDVLGTYNTYRTALARPVTRSALPRPQARTRTNTHTHTRMQAVARGSYFKLYVHTYSKSHLCTFIHYNNTTVYSISFYLFFFYVLLMAVFLNVFISHALKPQ